MSQHKLNADLPQPLARVEAAMGVVADDPLRQHAIALAGLEASIRWISIVLLRSYAEAKTPLALSRTVGSFLQRPSLGGWVEVVLRNGVVLPESLGEFAQPLEQFRTSLTGPSVVAGMLYRVLQNPDGNITGTLRPRPWHETLRVLPQYRNSYVGHGGFLDDEHFRKTAEPLLLGARELLSDMRSAFVGLRVLQPQQNGFRVLDLQGVQATSVGECESPPPGVAPLVPFLADLDSQQCLLSLGGYVLLVDHDVYLFEGAPPRQGVRYLEFCHGTHLRRDRSLVAFHGLGTEEVDSSRHDADGRPAGVATQLRVLKRRIRFGEAVPLRLVVTNRGRRELDCTAELQMRSPSWTSLESSRPVTVPVGETASTLLWAQAAASGVVDLPVADVSAADSQWSVPSDLSSLIVEQPHEYPMVGRGGVLSTAEQFLRSLRATPGSLLFFHGEAGSGKSALLDCISAMARRQGLLDLRAQPEGRGGESLKVCHDLLRDLWAFGEADHTESSLREFVAERAAEYLGEESSAADYFVDLVSEGEEPDSSEGARHYRWFRLLAGVCRDAPLVLLIDDIEGADAGTLALLRGVLLRAREEGLPLGLIATATVTTEATSEASLPLLSDRELGSQVVALPPLAAADVGQLLAELYPGAEYRDDMPWLPDILVERSGGNAAFLAELASGLGTSEGAWSVFESQFDGTWSMRAASSYDQLVAELPLHHSESLLEQIEDLPESAIEVLHCCAEFGNEFPVSVLEKLIVDEETLDGALDLLERRRLIAPVDMSLTRYRFVSSLTPRIVSEQLESRGNRGARRLRSRIADVALEEWGGEGRHSAWIGSILSRAGRLREAFPFLLAAVRRRALRGQYAEAAAILKDHERGLAEVATTDDESRFDLSLAEGLVRMNMGDLEGARDVARRALQIGRDAGRSEQVLVALNHLAGVELRRSAFDDAAQYAQEGKLLAEKLGAKDELLSARNLVALVCKNQGQLPEAKVEYQNILTELPPSKSVQRIGVLTNLGHLEYQQGNFDAAESCYQQALQAGDKSGSIDVRTLAQVGLSNVRFQRGDLDSARSGYVAAIDVFRKLQNRHALARNYKNLGDVETLRGRLDTASEAYERSVLMRVKIGDRVGEAHSRLALASIRIRVGRVTEAREQCLAVGDLGAALGRSDIVLLAEARETALRWLCGEELVERNREPLPAEAGAELVVWDLVQQFLLTAARGELVAQGSVARACALFDETASLLSTSEQACWLAVGLAVASDGQEARRPLRSIVQEPEKWPTGTPLEAVGRAIQLVEGDGAEWSESLVALRTLLHDQAHSIADADFRQAFLSQIDRVFPKEPR